MRPIILALTLATLLGGCATEGPPDPALVAQAERPIPCTAGPDCEAKWSRAIRWVAETSHWRIQTQTDQLIATFGPMAEPVFESIYSGFTVTKSAEPAGGYRIEMRSACANPFGCAPAAVQLKAAFVPFVLGETP